jgi:PIN domain nuclease of toxin-antitoxin system
MLTSSVGLASPAKVLLDTHVWVWLALGESTRLPKSLVRILETASSDGRLHVSAASVWEIALKAARGLLEIPIDLSAWVAEQRKYPGIKVFPLSIGTLIDSTRLPPWIRKRDGKEHKDPSDRFIVTTARRKRACLVTSDEEIIEYAKVDHVTVFDARR